MAASVPTNDDIDAALGEIARRIELLRAVRGDSFANARAESVRALQQHEQGLRQVKEGFGQVE